MTQPTLLIVDDEQSFTEILSQRLSKRGFSVKSASDGRTAINQILNDEAIEVVILDIAMPGMNGIDTLEAIKKDHVLTEVIMLTGRGTVDTAVESIRRGAFNYLMKPCEIEDLLTNIQNALTRRRDREAKILEVRMQPYLPKDKRDELIKAILEE